MQKPDNKLGVKEPKYLSAANEFRRRAECGQRAFLWSHESCGAKWIVPMSCDSRWCAKCARKRADGIVMDYLDRIREFKRPVLVTLTVPNCHEENLMLHLFVLRRAFQSLRRSKCWKASKGLYAIEVKWSRAKGYHPHIHAIFDWSWTDYEDLAARWRAACEKLFRKAGRPWVKVLHQPDIKWIRSKSLYVALREVVKYACGAKRGEGAAEFGKYPPDVQFAIAACMSGSRMVQPCGGLRRLEKPEFALRCPRCGAEFGPWDSGFQFEAMSFEEAWAVRWSCWPDYESEGWKIEKFRFTEAA